MTLFPDFKHDDDIRWVVVHGEQVVLKSKKAFEALTFVEAMVVSMYYPLHEADISKFAAAADSIIERNRK